MEMGMVPVATGYFRAYSSNFCGPQATKRNHRYEEVDALNAAKAVCRMEEPA